MSKAKVHKVEMKKDTRAAETAKRDEKIKGLQTLRDRQNIDEKAELEKDSQSIARLTSYSNRL